jgi:3'(2'), 5'-bisphosphate nucleotidase
VFVPVTHSQEKQVAINAVRQAAKLCSLVRAEMVGADSMEKGDKSPVTVADLGAQALVCQHLITAFPRDAIVGEEDSTDLRKPANAPKLAQVTRHVRRFHVDATPEMVCEWIDAGNKAVSERYWTLDPIDGTKGFLRNDQYAVALALVERGTVKVGALACPALPANPADSNSQVGVLFVAVQGEGAAMAPLGGGPFVPIQVASATDENTFRFVESVESAHGNQTLQRTIAQAVGIKQPSLRMDSQAKYGAVARGDAVLYLRLPSTRHTDYRENIWDHAAGALIVKEAGGQVTDMYGHPLDFGSDQKMHNNRGVVVSNGRLHPRVIEALVTFQ